MIKVRKINKILILTFAIILGSITNIKQVFAQGTVSTELTGYFWDRKEGTHEWEGSFKNYYIDGIDSFCLDPLTHEGGELTQTNWDIANIPQQFRSRISLIAFYGYSYPGHQTLKYRMATQAMIWETVRSDYNAVVTFSHKRGGGEPVDISYEREEIERLIQNHYVKPSFINKAYNVIMGESFIIEDENNVLSSYDVTADNIDYEINNNKLIITPKTTGIINITFTKKMFYGIDYRIFTSNQYQNMIIAGNVDPSMGKILLNSKGGKIKITKVDAENNNTVASGDATLVGAKYGIYDKNNILVETLTIGDDYTSTSNYLDVGTYTVKEISPSNGYLLDNNVYTVIINSSEVINLTVKESVIKGKIKITKYDSEKNSCISQGQAVLKGAKYQIMDINNNVVDILTIGDDCTALSKSLPYGDYKIKEVEASEGYTLDTTIYNKTISKNEVVVDVLSKEPIIKGKIKLIKIDKETNSCTPQGQATLEGAKYQIIDIKNNVVDAVIIDKNCTAISRDLPYGDYKVKEVEAPKGYDLDKNIYTIAVKKQNQTLEITSKEQVFKNYISILKQYDYVDGTTQFLNAEANIKFEIYDDKEELYDTITTDKNGYATIEIPYGIWKFHQVNSSTGFEKIYDFYITVDDNSEKEQYYNILNNSLSAYLQVIKVDEETGKTIAIADTTFKIFDEDTKQYVSQFVGGKVISEFKTDENGILVTPLKLQSGNYKLIEVSAPNGYLKDNNGLDFTIGNDTYFNYTTYGAFITVTYKNTPIKGQLEIHKIGEDFIIKDGEYIYDKKELSGVTFEIYAEEDILSADGNDLYYNNGDLVDTIITNEHGYAKTRKLPLGKYYLIEIKTLDDYILDNNKHYFELKEIDDKTPVVYETYSALNYLKKATIEFTKTDLVNGDVIADTIIEIYTDKDELIFTGKTDKDGKIVINDLKIGKYYILEKEAPEGYTLNPERMYFEILKDGEIVKAEMKDKPITGTLEFTKTDISTGETLPNTTIEIYNENDKPIFSGITDENGKIIISELRYGKYYIVEKEAPEGYILNTEKMYFEILEDGEVIKTTMTNKPITGTLELTKTDISTSETLPNTTVEIYNENDELIFSGITDESGKIIISELRYGKYYIVEKEAPKGYILNTEKMYFEILKDGEIVKATMINKPITGTLEFTKTDISTSETLPNTTIEIYSENDELIFSGITDENGKIIISELRYGKYYIIEKEAPEGYILNTEKMYFEILEDGEIVKATMTNERVIVDVPNTESNAIYINEIFGILLISCGIGVIVYAKKKKRKNK